MWNTRILSVFRMALWQLALWALAAPLSSHAVTLSSFEHSLQHAARIADLSAGEASNHLDVLVAAARSDRELLTQAGIKRRDGKGPVLQARVHLKTAVETLYNAQKSQVLEHLEATVPDALERWANDPTPAFPSADELFHFERLATDVAHTWTGSRAMDRIAHVAFASMDCHRIRRIAIWARLYSPYFTQMVSTQSFYRTCRSLPGNHHWPRIQVSQQAFERSEVLRWELGSLELLPTNTTSENCQWDLPDSGFCYRFTVDADGNRRLEAIDRQTQIAAPALFDFGKSDHPAFSSRALADRRTQLGFSLVVTETGERANYYDFDLYGRPLKITNAKALSVETIRGLLRSARTPEFATFFLRELERHNDPASKTLLTPEPLIQELSRRFSTSPIFQAELAYSKSVAGWSSAERKIPPSDEIDRYLAAWRADPATRDQARALAFASVLRKQLEPDIIESLLTMGELGYEQVADVLRNAQGFDSEHLLWGIIIRAQFVKSPELLFSKLSFLWTDEDSNRDAVVNTMVSTIDRSLSPDWNVDIGSGIEFPFVPFAPIAEKRKKFSVLPDRTALVDLLAAPLLDKETAPWIHSGNCVDRAETAYRPMCLLATLRLLTYVIDTNHPRYSEIALGAADALMPRDPITTCYVLWLVMQAPEATVEARKKLKEKVNESYPLPSGGTEIRFYDALNGALSTLARLTDKSGSPEKRSE